MWCFNAYKAIRNNITASPGALGRAAQKTRAQISQEPDTTQHIFGQKLDFTMGHDPNNVSIAK